jgi:hypothetical protein
MRAMIFPPDTCGVQAAVSLVARGINPEPWSYSAEQDAWRLICATVREGRLRAYIIVLESGKTYEAERGQFAGLEGRLSEVRMRAVALRDSLGQNHWSPFCDLLFYEDDLHAALRAESAEKAAHKSAEASKGRSGRRPTYNPKLIEDEVIRLMEERGEFDVRNKEWNYQARLEVELQKYCEGEFGEEPVRSTLQAHIANGLAKWRGELAEN